MSSLTAIAQKIFFYSVFLTKKLNFRLAAAGVYAEHGVAAVEDCHENRRFS